MASELLPAFVAVMGVNVHVDSTGEDEVPVQGGFNNNLSFKLSKYSNAYMLVYVRVDDWDRIQCSVTEQDIAEHLRVRLKVPRP